MARSSTRDWHRPSVEFGWPSVDLLDSQPVWRLWKSGAPTAAEICTHPLGYALRLYVRGRLLYSSVHPMRKAAEREASELRRHWLAQQH